jgi:hypothetical protein
MAAGVRHAVDLVEGVREVRDAWNEIVHSSGAGVASGVSKTIVANSANTREARLAPLTPLPFLSFLLSERKPQLP